LSKARRYWPDDSDLGCELYAFMQGELASWRRKFELPERATVVEFLAQLEQRMDVVDSCAAYIASRFPPGKTPIVAFASFIPEISGKPKSERAERSQAALRFLCRLALALRDVGHPVGAIEAVAGSSINGIWRGARPQSPSALLPCFQANILRGNEPLARLIAGLRAGLEPISDELRQHRLAIAMELEPGPLYVLRDWATLNEFCEQIREDPILCDVVGLNLDIAHWNMAPGVTPERVRATPNVMERIVHAHCSGHHPQGHFGDACIFDLNDPATFVPYVDLLQEIAAGRGDSGLPFSGYVSVEFEAARSPALVRTSVERLKELL
jgi:hypothetical protein